MEMSRDNDRQTKEAHKLSRDNDQKDTYKSNEMQLQNHSLTFIHKSNSQLPALCLVHPWLTTLLLPWTS